MCEPKVTLGFRHIPDHSRLQNKSRRKYTNKLIRTPFHPCLSSAHHRIVRGQHYWCYPLPSIGQSIVCRVHPTFLDSTSRAFLLPIAHSTQLRVVALFPIHQLACRLLLPSPAYLCFASTFCVARSQSPPRAPRHHHPVSPLLAVRSFVIHRTKPARSHPPHAWFLRLLGLLNQACGRLIGYARVSKIDYLVSRGLAAVIKHFIHYIQVYL